MATQKAPVDAMTTRHILFLVFMHGLGSMILDGAINFGLAVAMYKTSNDPVHLWSFPNTLAGDATVTVIVQQLLTWILDQLSVRGDVKRGVVAPLRMPKDANVVLRWFVGVDTPKFGQKKTAKEFLIFHGQRVFALILGSWFVYWPIAIGVLSALRSNNIGVDTRGVGGDFNNWPLPEIFKGVYGFALGMTTPFVAYIQLIYLGETTNADSESELPARVSDGENDEVKLTDQ
ncbi:hypothetical protein BGX26_010528 [Mortierella sp. AD094]|nr:hypothetical protein BGX26_010528 [Mortierella sp. AD094]